MELTDKEIEVLLNTIGKMNRYEMMAILCKTYNDSQIEDACTKLVNVYVKLSRDKKEGE